MEFIMEWTGVMVGGYFSARRCGEAEGCNFMFSLRTGLLSVSALIVLPVLIHAQPCGHTPAWSPCELVVELSDQAAAKHPNPYQTVEMRADFRSTDLRAMSVPAYWDGEKRMVLRFAPSRAGEWQYRIDSNVAD